MKPLEILSVTPPALRKRDVASAVARQFGLQGQYEQLVSERDQNFRLKAAGGREFVVKVTSVLEDSAATDFQIGTLLHLGSVRGIHTPQIVQAVSGRSTGEISDGETTYRLRVVSWVHGEQLATQRIDSKRAGQFGAALAILDRALESYEFDGDDPVLIWDLQRVAELRPLLDCIDDVAVRDDVGGAIDDYENIVVPMLKSLPRQVIHSDANPENVLLTDDGIGFIDFSDIVRAPRVFDVAIAASYLRSFGDDPTTLVRPFVAGYRGEVALGSAERDLLFELIRARLATTITMLYWRLRDRPEQDEYRQKSLELERSASHFLRDLNRFGKSNFRQKIK